MNSDQHLSQEKNDGEILQDYARQFNISTGILGSNLGGTFILEKYLKNTNVYDETDRNKTKKTAKQDP